MKEDGEEILPAGSIRGAEIPFKSIHYTQLEFKKFGSYFINHLPVDVSIKVQKIREHTPLLYPYVYTISLEHAGLKWSVERRYPDFRHLHDRLLMHRAKEKIKGPIRRKLGQGPPKVEKSVSQRIPLERRDGVEDVEYVCFPIAADLTQNQLVSESISDGDNSGAIYGYVDGTNTKEKIDPLPHFPQWPESMIGLSQIGIRRMRLERYLKAVLSIPFYRSRPETAEFLEVSRFSFINNLDWKSKEGFVKKRPGGRKGNYGFKLYCTECCTELLARSGTKWMFIKDSFIAYMEFKSERLEEVMLFDRTFEVQLSRKSDGPKYGIVITNLHRELTLKLQSMKQAEEWKSAVEKAIRSENGRVWLQTNRFLSSYPLREDGKAQWFVDGHLFMSAVANVLETAKEEIFITGWWIHPMIYLKRPIRGNRWRLDQVLKRKAESGVKIFILMYKEVKVALNINSQFTRDILSSHPNIQILRHPNQIPVNFWSHHEKLVIVDQNIAFVGGIDLCFGRWDDPRHLISDSGMTTAMAPTRGGSSQMSSLGSQPITSSSVHLGPPSDEQPKIAQSDLKGSEKSSGETGCLPKKKKSKLNAMLENSETYDGKLWPGKDYVNYIQKDFVDVHLPFEDLVDREITPRMPWHDIHAAVFGSAAKDLARHFIERWNAVKVEKAKEKQEIPFLIPKSPSQGPQLAYSRVAIPCRVQVRQKMERGVGRSVKVFSTCQPGVLRSVSKWSAGVSVKENSLGMTMAAMITEAQHYIYIENQFFISLLGSSPLSEVTNQISMALFERITLAHRLGQTFRVYVVLPLLPAFEGSIEAGAANSLLKVMYWTYKSISNGPQSLLVRLQETIDNPSQYIVFCGLRTHGTLMGAPVSEFIYVHSKMMIVDDRKTLIGSANINDRSLLGERDSEVAIYVEDTEFQRGTMNGKSYRAGRFALSLRKYLFQEHLGLLPHDPNSTERLNEIDFSDPVADSFYTEVWLRTAQANTIIFEEVFKCIPTDSALTYEELKSYRESSRLVDTDSEAARKELKKLQGKLVMFPTKFLTNSDLTPPPGKMENYLPDSIYV